MDRGDISGNNKPGEARGTLAPVDGPLRGDGRGDETLFMLVGLSSAPIVMLGRRTSAGVALERAQKVGWWSMVLALAQLRTGDVGEGER